MPQTPDEEARQHLAALGAEPDERMDPQNQLEMELTYGLTCGCGIPEEIMALARDFLEAASGDSLDRTKNALEVLQKADRETLEFAFLAALSQRGWTEHGTTIRYSWATPKGEAALAAIKSIDWDE